METLTEEQEARPKLARARHKSQLEFLANRGAVTDRQRATGERLARDFSVSGGLPKLVASYEPQMARPGKRQFLFSGDDYSPVRLDARDRFERALQAVGLRLNPLLVHVAICDLPLGDWSRPGMHNGDGAALLRLALDVLGDHYHLPDPGGMVGHVNGEAREAA